MNQLMRIVVCLGVMWFGAVCSAAESAPKNWNQYRGYGGDGRADAADLPVEFGESQNVKWKVPMQGKAWSSPVIWGDDIWLTNAQPDGKQMFAVRVDANSGKVLKTILVFENSDPKFCYPMNSYATPTPVVEANKVYVHFGVHGTACLDAQSGKTLWERRDLKCNHHRGPASSPIVWNDLLILLFDGFDVQYVVALNKNTGKTVWKHKRAFDFKTTNGDRMKAYCTPTVIEHKGRVQLICPAAVATEALDPKTGKVLWTVRHGGMNASARPIYGDGLLFISNGMGSMVAVNPSGKGDVTKVYVAWSTKRNVPKKSSLVFLDGHLYMISDNGVASCLVAKTGKVVWSERLTGDLAASPILAKGKLYFFDRAGKAPVIAAATKFKKLANNKLPEGCMASPAISGNAMIVRTTGHLYRFEK